MKGKGRVFVKGKGRVEFKKIQLRFFFNIVLTWKIVEVSEVLVIYILIRDSIIHY